MKFFLLILVWVHLAVFTATPTLAQSKSFKLDQTKFLLQTSANKELTESLIIKNLSDQVIEVNFAWEGYEFTSEHSIDFAQISPQKLTLQPFAIGSTEIMFKTPANLKPGDYYGRVLASVNNEKVEAKFTLRYLGELKESLELKSSEVLGKTIKLTLKNNGNVSTNASGKLTLTNFFGQNSSNKNIEHFEIKAKEEIIISHVVNTIPGPYQANLSLIFGDKKTQLTKVQPVWIQPIYFWTGSSFLVLIIIFGVFSLARFRRFHA